jgi:hypothetical protein
MNLRFTRVLVLLLDDLHWADPGPHRDNPRRFVEVLVDFIQSTASAQVDEQRWRERLRNGSRLSKRNAG